MKKSKHFRKDVILARVIFAILCIIIIVLIWMGVSALMGKMQGDEEPSTENKQTENLYIPQVEQTQADTEEETEPEPEIVYYAKAKANVRMRQEPNTNCAVLANVPVGTKMDMLEEADGWYKVLYNGQEGYIRADYIEVIEEMVYPRRSGGIIMLDPGHQAQADMTKEPNGPDSMEMKARVTGGTKGTATDAYEYELALEIAFLLRDELEDRGYTVLLTRETHEVNLSNMERAQIANDSGADIVVRIHANGDSNSSSKGAETLAPSAENVYVGTLAEESQRLSRCIIDAYCDSTGMRNRGVKLRDDMTGMNWSKIPVTIIELGFMSNPTDDKNMQEDAYQKKMAQGIADGIDDYFSQ